jgi:hypothetical protein
MPRLRVTNHPGDYVFPGALQRLQNIRMRRVRIVVKEFDPPITLSTDLSGRLQDDALEQLPPFHGLDCADQAMPAMGIAQPALAPLLVGREQALHRPEFHELLGYR